MNRLYRIILLLMMAVAAHGQMDSTVINLKNVVVTGKAGTKSVTAERTRINPSATMSSATGSVLEVLRSSSAVTIDGSGQVSIRGNGNVFILVAGTSRPTTPSIPLLTLAATVAASSGSVSPGISTPTSPLSALRSRKKTAASSGWENDKYKINP